MAHCSHAIWSAGGGRDGADLTPLQRERASPPPRSRDHLRAPPGPSWRASPRQGDDNRRGRIRSPVGLLPAFQHRPSRGPQPGNPCGFTLPDPERHVQAAHSHASPWGAPRRHLAVVRWGAGRPQGRCCGLRSRGQRYNAVCITSCFPLVHTTQKARERAEIFLRRVWASDLCRPGELCSLHRKRSWGNRWSSLYAEGHRQQNLHQLGVVAFRWGDCFPLDCVPGCHRIGWQEAVAYAYNALQERHEIRVAWPRRWGTPL